MFDLLKSWQCLAGWKTEVGYLMSKMSVRMSIYTPMRQLEDILVNTVKKHQQPVLYIGKRPRTNLLHNSITLTIEYPGVRNLFGYCTCKGARKEET